ncbi:Poly [ADP-ribose] polymerase 2 [Raphanus sativus]|nr:Poly [ADP-ribose] polymerase 2 [Raphanus sativus]
MLLWHGSRLTNWASILTKGLQIAPPEAPHCGYMFGKGVYFADMLSKSKCYSFYENSVCKDGILLLCEVALGEMVELQREDFSANILPPGKLRRMGRRGPNPKEARTLEDGVIVPLGCPVDLNDYKSQLWHSEYIVYDPGQIKIRYLIHVRIQPGN